MKIKKKAKIVITIFVIMFFYINIAFADVGSFDSYDSESSSSSSSSSWDSSSSSWDSYDSYGGYSGYSDGLYMVSDTTFLIILIVLIVIVVIYQNGKRRNQNISLDKNESKYNSKTVYTTSVHDVPITHIYAHKIKEMDPLFSEEKFLSMAKDLYIKLQHAWTDRNWEEMRTFETETLFEQHAAQLQEYIRNNTINVVERIAVNYATIYKFRQTEDKDIVEVALKATKKDYIIDVTTKEVVEGNKDQYRITLYKMTFERTKGILTKEGTEELDAKNCPNCGAPLKITTAGKCEYCGSIVTVGEHDWVLSNLEPFKNI